MTVRVGWLQQDIGIRGGAEMSCGALVEDAPEWAEVVYCPPRKRPPRDIDVFCIENSTTYGPQWIDELALKPVIRHVRDPWYAGSSVLRRWLLDNADLLIFSSPVQAEHFRYPHDRPVRFVPPPVRLEPFREAALPEEERESNVFVGRVEIYKGAMYAIDWALREDEPLDLYGNARYMDFGPLPGSIRIHGEVPYERMPEILGRAKRYVAFPTWVEAFGRSVAEAWAAGCELVVEGRVGAIWWITHEPERLGYEGPVAEFWECVKEVAYG